MISGNITEEAWRVKQERKKANTTILSELFDIGYYTAVKKKNFPIQATGCTALTNDAERKGDRMSICYVVPFK